VTPREANVKTTSLIALLALLAACGAGSGPEQGRIATTVAAITLPSAVTRVHVAVAPDGSSADLARDESGSFSGLLVVGTGAQTITATAYTGDAAVGTGSADVTVEPAEETSVYLRIVDTTGAAPVPDHGPVITSFVIPQPVTLGRSYALTATAVEPDGEPLAYTWSSSCGGVFAAGDTPSATWTPFAPGPCTLTLAVTSNGLVDRGSAQVVVFP
jgi:hypothetical protein